MISFRLPDDEEMTLPVAHTEIEKNSATCTVVKDAGDDPDVTHGASIVVTVSFSNHPDIRFLQGEGVGRVTLPGLGLEIGGTRHQSHPPTNDNERIIGAL